MSLSRTDLTAAGSPQDDTNSSAASGDLLQSALQAEITRLTADHIAEGRNDVYREITSIAQRRVIDIVLGHYQGNKLQTSKRLGISRLTLDTKLKGANPS